MSYGVLLIEDEELLSKNIRLYLQRYGHDVQVAASAEAGLELLEQFKPDAVVLDFNLPGIDGLEALARIRRRDPNVIVVMMTGHGSEQIAVDAMKAGAFDYLTKPVALGKLKLVLDRALQAGRRDQELSWYRRREAADKGLAALVGESPRMRELRAQIRQIVEAERNLGGEAPPAVLINGETGTGKELVAHAFHYEGQRATGPFVEINCATIPAHLLESELFGHERGAFTDARERRIGLIEAADGGTLFLDEVGEIDPGLQVKLLKLLEDRKIRRLGSVREQQVSVRIVAATNRDLEQMVRDGRFRADLYFRLRILQVLTPPLRERAGDIELLAAHFLEQQRARYGKPRLTLGDGARDALRAHTWPGNVRELRNVIEQSVIMATGDVIEAPQLMLARLDQPSAQPGVAPAVPLTMSAGAIGGTLPEIERRLIQKALDAARWNVSKAARDLGVSRDTLRYRMEKFALKAPE